MKPIRERRRARATPAARTQAPIFAHARSSSSIVPATVSYGIRARVNAPAISGTQHAAQVASHSPVAVLAESRVDGGWSPSSAAGAFAACATGSTVLDVA